MLMLMEMMYGDVGERQKTHVKGIQFTLVRVVTSCGGCTTEIPAIGWPIKHLVLMEMIKSHLDLAKVNAPMKLPTGVMTRTP